MDNIRNYLTPRGAPPWNFKDYSQPYVTPLTNKTSLTLGISGGSFEKKFENMRGRKSIGYELGVDVVENPVFPQAVERPSSPRFLAKEAGRRSCPCQLKKPLKSDFFRPRPSLSLIISNANMAMRQKILN